MSTEEAGISTRFHSGMVCAAKASRPRPGEGRLRQAGPGLVGGASLKLDSFAAIVKY